jgi:Fe-S oxidoreductase
MLHEYEGLFEGQPTWQIRAGLLKEKVIDFTTFIDRVARLQPGSLASTQSEHDSVLRTNLGPVTYHSFCQSSNVLGITDAPKKIIRDVLGLELRDLPEETVCCGFGGSTSLTHPEVARAILKRKLENVLSTGSTILVTDNPGCILHLRGGIDSAGLGIRVLHIAELMARCLPPSKDSPAEDGGSSR